MDKNYYQYHLVVHVDVEDNVMLFHDSNDLIDDDSNEDIDLDHIPDFHTFIFQILFYFTH
jgi:hypothetical protein